MTVSVFLHGVLATHRRGNVLKAALSASASQELPEGQAILIAFGDDFQAAEPDQQTRLIDWTRDSGHLLLLIPPFSTTPCERPVSWRAERVEMAPRGGEGIAQVLASQVTYRLTGQLQTAAVPGATWSDLSVCMGTYRPHPAGGLFAVTCLPIWSLAMLDVPQEVETWLTSLVDLAGEVRVSRATEPVVLQPDHYGFLVFLLSQSFEDEEQVIAGLQSSIIFRFSAERGRSLLHDLRERGLVDGVIPTSEGDALVMQSPYAGYVSAVREIAR